MNRTARVLVVFAALLSSWTAASTAAAYSRCGKESAPHDEQCYAIDDWLMTGHEGVAGSSIRINSFAASVPDWASGDFVANESWATFDEGQHWVAVGQYAGGYWDESSLHYFWAFQNSEGYNEEEFAGGPEPNTWNTYTLQYANKPGTWNVFINGANVASATGLGTTSNNLQAGLVMTNTNIKNSGETANARSYSTHGAWSNGWSGGASYAEPESEGPGGGAAPNCIYALPGTRHGSIYFGAQPCGKNAGTEPRRTKAATKADVSELSVAQIKRLAVQWSRREGDPRPSGIAIARASRGKALELALPGTGLPPAASTATTGWLAQQALVVDVRGHFRTRARVPAGKQAPSGTVLSLVLDARTGEVSGRHIGVHPPRLRSLGPVQRLR
jgi:hypothetical protein